MPTDLPVYFPGEGTPERPCVQYRPPPYPDELFASLLARTLEINLIPLRPKRRLHPLVAPRFAGDPAVLKYFRYKVEDLPSIIKQLCIFPVLSPFLPISIRQQHLKWTADGLDRFSHAASRIPGLCFPDKARLCSLCVKEDTATYDEPYYHRNHQLPGLELEAASRGLI